MYYKVGSVKGLAGGDIEKINKLLTATKIARAKDITDNLVYSKATRDCVLNLQKTHDLEATGEVDDETYAMLNVVCKAMKETEADDITHTLVCRLFNKNNIPIDCSEKVIDKLKFREVGDAADVLPAKIDVAAGGKYGYVAINYTSKLGSNTKPIQFEYVHKDVAAGVDYKLMLLEPGSVVGRLEYFQLVIDTPEKPHKEIADYTLSEYEQLDNLLKDNKDLIIDQVEAIETIEFEEGTKQIFDNIKLAIPAYKKLSQKHGFDPKLILLYTWSQRIGKNKIGAFTKLVKALRKDPVTDFNVTTNPSKPEVFYALFRNGFSLGDDEFFHHSVAEVIDAIKRAEEEGIIKKPLDDAGVEVTTSIGERYSEFLKVYYSTFSENVKTIRAFNAASSLYDVLDKALFETAKIQNDTVRRLAMARLQALTVKLIMEPNYKKWGGTEDFKIYYLKDDKFESKNDNDFLVGVMPKIDLISKLCDLTYSSAHIISELFVKAEQAKIPLNSGDDFSNLPSLTFTDGNLYRLYEANAWEELFDDGGGEKEDIPFDFLQYKNEENNEIHLGNSKELFAAKVVENYERSFPSIAIEKWIDATRFVDLKIIENWIKEYDETNDAPLDLDADEVIELLQKHFAKVNGEFCQKSPGECMCGRDHEENGKELFKTNPAVYEMAARLHTIFQLSVSFDSFCILLVMEFSSAGDIAETPYEIFEYGYIREYKEIYDLNESKFVDVEDNVLADIDSIYTNSQQLAAVATNILTGVRSGLQAPEVNALSPQGGVSREQQKMNVVEHSGLLSAATKRSDATLSNLYGDDLDYCDCDHCKSILGPAAYLVDLLEFINPSKSQWRESKLRWLMGADDDQEDPQRPYEVLNARRSDIKNIKLNCANTNTLIPYIDIVNEVMETYIGNIDKSPELIKEENEEYLKFVASDTKRSDRDEFDYVTSFKMPEAQKWVDRANMELLNPTKIKGVKQPFDIHWETAECLAAVCDVSLTQVLKLGKRDEDYELYPLSHLGISKVWYTQFDSDFSADEQFNLAYGLDGDSAINTENLSEFSELKNLATKLSLTYKELVECLNTRFVVGEGREVLFEEVVTEHAEDSFSIKLIFVKEIIDGDKNPIQARLLKREELLKANLLAKIYKKLDIKMKLLDALFTLDEDQLSPEKIGASIQGRLIQVAKLSMLGIQLSGDDSVADHLVVCLNNLELDEIYSQHIRHLSKVIDLSENELVGVISTFGVNPFEPTKEALVAIIDFVALCGAWKKSKLSLEAVEKVKSSSGHQIFKTTNPDEIFDKLYSYLNLELEPDLQKKLPSGEGLNDLRERWFEDTKNLFSYLELELKLGEYPLKECLSKSYEHNAHAEVFISMVENFYNKRGETKEVQKEFFLKNWRKFEVSIVEIDAMNISYAEYNYLCKQCGETSLGGSDLSIEKAVETLSEYRSILSLLGVKDDSLVEAIQDKKLFKGFLALHCDVFEPLETQLNDYIFKICGLAISLTAMKAKVELWLLKQKLEMPLTENVVCIQSLSNIWEKGDKLDIVKEWWPQVVARYQDFADEWRQRAKPHFDKLRQKKRDALVSYLRSKDEDRFGTIEKIYEYFLLDPKMEPVFETSRIKQATLSVQLFINRCFLNLEDNVHASSLNRKYWNWMQSYRVWEANRKIFLHPENWLEPEFRKGKSHLFEEFEAVLLQGDLSQESLENALFSYLKGLEQIAKLKVVSTYCEQKYASSGGAILHVIAKTKGMPSKYFYRSYDKERWSPWLPVDAPVEGDHVTLASWNGRLSVFWFTFIEKAIPKFPEPVDPPKPFDFNTIRPSMTIDAQVHWADYFQNEWSEARSSALNNPMTLELIDNERFDPLKLRVEVSEGAANRPELGSYVKLLKRLDQARLTLDLLTKDSQTIKSEIDITESNLKLSEKGFTKEPKHLSRKEHFSAGWFKIHIKTIWYINPEWLRHKNAIKTLTPNLAKLKRKKASVDPALKNVKLRYLALLKKSKAEGDALNYTGPVPDSDSVLYISLHGEQLTPYNEFTSSAFKLLHRNGEPEIKAAIPMKSVPYFYEDRRYKEQLEKTVGGYKGRGGFMVDLPDDLSNIPPHQIGADIYHVLNSGELYHIHPCVNRVNVKDQRLSAALTPFFYEDDEHLMFVDPTLQQINNHGDKGFPVPLVNTIQVSNTHKQTTWSQPSWVYENGERQDNLELYKNGKSQDWLHRKNTILKLQRSRNFEDDKKCEVDIYFSGKGIELVVSPGESSNSVWLVGNLISDLNLSKELASLTDREKDKQTDLAKKMIQYRALKQTKK